MCIHFLAPPCIRMEHILRPARLHTQMHENLPYKTACTNDLPHAEHVMFETRR